MPEPTARLLPFSVSTKDRVLSFPEEMEKAAVFYKVENDRRKTEGLILKKPPEELMFIMKSCYPIWLAEWNDKILFFDGLGVSTGALSHEVLPDVAKFLNDVQGSATRREAYAAALADYARYFVPTKKVEKRIIAGLIVNLDFICDFQTYSTEAEEVDESVVKSEGCLPPLISDAAITSAVEEISELRAWSERDIQSLREAMKLITDTTREHVNAVREEVRRIQGDLTEKIASAKADAMQKVQLIQGRFDARILKASQNYDQALKELDQERVKLVKAQDRASLQVEQSENEIRASKDGRDAAGERRWREEKQKWKREISALKDKVRDVDRQIKEVESKRNVEISNIRAEFNAQSEFEMREVRELEAEKESKTQLSEKEIKSLENSTSLILQQLETTAKRKRTAIEQLDMIAMNAQRRRSGLVYVPFYLACFKAGEYRRYEVYSPVIVGSMKRMTKFRSMLGASKMKSLFQHRSKALNDLLRQLTVAIERDPVFKREIDDLGGRDNILRDAESRERIVRGLEGLRDEGWLSPVEVQTLSTFLKGV